MSASESVEKRSWRLLAIDDEQSVHETYRSIFDQEVEDELSELELLTGLIDEEEPSEEENIASQFALDHALGGEEGYQQVVQAHEEGNPYAVIYLDMRMPAGWDGLETAEKIREIDTEVRIVLITAYMDYSLTEIRERIGVNFDFLTKPVDVNELLQLTLSLATQWSQSRDLELALEQAQAASKAKDDFLASMSHELRTPLTAIIGNSELMEGTPLTDEQQGLLNSIEISSRRLLSLINDILDLSKIESGKFEVDQVSFDINHLLHELEQTFALRAKEAGLQFKVKLREPLEWQWMGDERRICQVLLNLLGNALKFTEKGGVTLEVWFDEVSLHFSVADTGIGISAEVMERLFSPFEQADQSISRRYGGTGLGLHISKNLAEMMGGDISVESQEGHGSRFTLTLPLHWSEEKAGDLPQVSQANKATRFLGRVLVAEDTPELQILERKILEAAGVEVTVANNGKEAVEHGLATPFDLVLMDMQMPEMDGIEATQLMRSVGCETPIVALTANVMQQHREQFEAAGCSGFLSKPIDQPRLMEVLSQYLEPQPDDEVRFQGKVLVADGDDEQRQALQQLIEQYGPEITIAHDGKEAVEHGLTTPYDLVLMTRAMPEMDAVEATQLMRSVGCESPIIAISGAVAGEREGLEAAGCSGVIERPDSPEVVEALLAEYLQPAVADSDETASVDSFVDEELMALFVERSAVQQEAIQQALTDEDWGEVRAIAHTVKGSGATFGFPEITRLGKEICDYLDNGEQGPVPELVLQLIEALAAIAQA